MLSSASGSWARPSSSTRRTTLEPGALFWSNRPVMVRPSVAAIRRSMPVKAFTCPRSSWLRKPGPARAVSPRARVGRVRQRTVGHERTPGTTPANTVFADTARTVRRDTPPYKALPPPSPGGDPHARVRDRAPPPRHGLPHPFARGHMQWRLDRLRTATASTKAKKRQALTCDYSSHARLEFLAAVHCTGPRAFVKESIRDLQTRTPVKQEDRSGVWIVAAGTVSMPTGANSSGPPPLQWAPHPATPRTDVQHSTPMHPRSVAHVAYGRQPAQQSAKTPLEPSETVTRSHTRPGHSSRAPAAMLTSSPLRPAAKGDPDSDFIAYERRTGRPHDGSSRRRPSQCAPVRGRTAPDKAARSAPPLWGQDSG